MKEILNQVKKITEEILSKEFKHLKNLHILKEQGVYIIKDKNKNKIIYIGKSKNLFNRIIKQHTSKKNNVSGSILRLKLHGKGLEYDKIKDYLEKDCLFIIYEIQNFDICAIVEDLLIAIFRKQKEPLLNM